MGFLKSFDQFLNEGILNNSAFLPENIEKWSKKRGCLPLVRKVASWTEKCGKKIAGGTAVGKDYGTLILDLKYQGGEISIDLSDEIISVQGEEVNSFEEFKIEIENI